VTVGTFLPHETQEYPIEEYGNPKNFCYKFTPAVISPEACGPPIYKFSTNRASFLEITDMDTHYYPHPGLEFSTSDDGQTVYVCPKEKGPLPGFMYGEVLPNGNTERLSIWAQNTHGPRVLEPYSKDTRYAVGCGKNVENPHKSF
jgi:hypothetical protein